MAGIISNKYTGTDSASPLSWGLVVKEVDGIPTVGNVNTIIVSNGTLTDNGGGVVTILTSGGGGGGIPSGPQYAVQLNDGAGNFVGSANYTYDYAAFELTVNGKIIMNNIVEDTTGIDFSPVAANPGTTAAETLWSNSTDANNLYYGANAVLNDASTFTLFDIEDDTTSTTTISRFDNLEMSGGTGISTALAAGPELIFTNTGVTSIVAGTGITISGPTGAVTITSSTTGTVTSVATANSTFVSLAGGPITTTGTLTASLSATGTADATTFLRGDNTWTTPSSGMVTFTVSGDAGVAQTISDGNNLQILGSTTAGSGADLAGVLDTVAAAGDLLYIETREMTGASGVADGATGFAPKALTGEEDYYLAGDASWKVLPVNYSWTVSDGTTTDIISDGETVQFQGTATQLVATVAAGTPALVTYALVNVNTSGSGAYAYPSNITVDLQGRITAITASGAPSSGTVTEIIFSDGSNTDTITTSGTIEIVGGTAIDSTLNPATGVFTLTSTGVNSLANVGGTYAGTGASYVIPSAATGSGIDLELTTTGVAAGSYTATNLTVDTYGRLTAASDGSASIVNTKFYIEDDAANNELVSTNDTILLKEGLGGVSVVVSNPDTVTYGLDTTGVAAASYIAADITVDAYGRLSAASQGTQFSGGANVGIVPTAAAAANNTYLEKDGTWTDPLAGLAAGNGISFAAPTISVNLTASTGLQFNGGTTALEGTTFTTANIGMVPAPGAINNYFLRDDGTWVAVGGSGTVTSVATANSTFVSITGGPITTTGTLTASLSATGTASAGTFLRGDNTWATPGGGFSNFNISDGVTTQTINSTDTITFTGGTALTGAVSATDTVTYSLDNTVVTPGSYTYGSFTVDQQGRLTAASSGGAPGTMSTWILTGDSGTQTINDADTVDIAGGTGITTAASATDTLTVTLDDTAVTPGSYTYSSLTVDQQGRLTAASSGTSPGTMSSFTAAGSSGSSQTISDGDTFTIAQGAGITSVASATDTITITNTGVTSIVAGTNISISGATGAVTINSTDQFTGTVTSVATSSGTFVDVTGGTITTTGTITGDLSATGTADATTFLRGDNTWASPAGSFTFDVVGSTGTTETISSGDTLTIAQGTGITAVSSATDTVTITNTLPFNSLTLAGDSGTQTVVDQDTITIAGGTGLTTVAATTDTVTVTLDDTLVTPGSYTYSSFTVDQQGRLTDAASGSAPGTMSDFIISDAAAATQIVGNGDTITFIGGTALTSAVTATDTVTFNLDDTGVTPGSYTYSSLTVDQQGRLTAASSGSAPGTMSSFDLDGDSGSTQTISDGSTMTIAGGTALSSVAANFDTVTLNLDNTAVAAGSYTYSSLTVDAQGRLTSASSGVAPGTMDDFIISDGVTTQTISDGDTLIFASGSFIDQTVTATDTVTSDLSASGSPTIGTFLRGDNQWATPAGGFSNFDIESDPATVTETINSGDTITFIGDPGLTASVSVTDTVTLSLDNTAVSAGSYTYSSLTVDAQGRLTAASSGAAPGTMDDWILSGDSGTPQTIADGTTVDIAGGVGLTTTASAPDTLTVDLADTVVTPGSYTYSSVTVDQQGRLTAASSGAAPGTMDDFIISDGSTTQTIADGDTLTFTASTGITAVVSATDTLTITNTLPFNSLSLAGDSGPIQTITDGNTITVAGGTALSSVASATDTITLNLDNTAVVAATYGSTTEVGQFTVDAQGRLTAATDVAIIFPFNSFNIVTDPPTVTQTISDLNTLTFTSGTFITQTVAATDTVTGDLSATGTASASTFLRGDNTWASPAGSFTFDVEGSSGTTETISSGDTLTIAQGTGISSVSSNPDTITITNTGVTSAVAGTGIGVSGATGAVTISNTGVTSIVAGTNISISGATGAVTIDSTDQFVGTVTSIATSSGTFVDVTGGTITTTGTITGDLSATGTASMTTFLRGDNTWGTPAGTATSFDLTGDTGTTEAVTDGDTVTIAGGTGLSSVSSNPDTVTLNLDNTAVSGGSYTYSSITVDAQGRLTAASSGATPGTMSDWTLDGDLGAPQTISNSDTVMMAGGTGITTTASATDTLTVDLDDTAVTPAAYTYASITVDQQGRLTSASSGTPPSTFTFDAAGSSGSAQAISSGDTLTIAQGTGITSVAGATDTITITNTLPFNSLTLAGDSGSETVLDGDTITIAGGTGLTTAAAAIDTVTVTLDNTAVVAASYTYASLTVDAQGRLTAASSGTAPGTMDDFTVAADSGGSQTISDADILTLAGGTAISTVASVTDTVTFNLDDTAVTPASYTYGSFTVDQQGRLTAASSGSAPGTMSSFNLIGDTGTTEVISDGDSVDIAGGTGISTVASATDTVTVNLDDTAVTGASYGDATNVPSFTVDAQGRLTAASDVAITFPTVVTSVAGTTPINVSASTGSVTISSDAYGGTTVVGYVPTGGTATTYLRGDGTWADPGAEFNFTVDADTGAGFTVDDGDAVTITATGTGLSFAAATDTITLSGTLDVDNGGTGQTSYTDGQLLIGNTTGNTLAKGTLTAGTNISITNAAGSITIDSTDQYDGTVTSVALAAPSAFTVTGSPVTTSGTLTFAGAGTSSQVVLGDGTLGTLPTGTMSSFDLEGDTGTTETVVDGNTVIIAGGTGLASVASNPDTVTLNLADTIVSPAAYGSATEVATFTVDQQGRLTAAADVSITFPTVVTDLTATTPINVDVSTGSVTISSDVYAGATAVGYVPTGGSAVTYLRGDGSWINPPGALPFNSLTLAGDSGSETVLDGDTITIAGGTGITTAAAATDTVTVTLDDTAVTLGSYGSATTVPSFTVDQQGRLTAAADVTISAVPAALTATYVGYGSATNLLTGTANYTWTNASNLLTLGAAAGTATITAADGSTSAGAALTLTGGDGAGTNQDGGNITLTPGALTGTGTRGSLVLDYSTYPAADATGVLTSDGAGGLSWGTPAGTYTFDIAGDTGAGSTIASGDTVTINAAGTGLSFAAATDTFTLSGTLDVDHGGTGQTTYTDGQLLIGNSTGNTLDKATLSAGTDISITNAGGSITINNTGSTSGVSSLSATTPVNVSGATGAVTVSADAYTGTTGIGYVPAGGTASLYLRGDGTWVNPPGAFTSFTVNADGGAGAQTITDGDNLNILGGTGLTSLTSATDVVTLNLDNTTVVAGSYTAATITVDAQGRLTAASASGAGAYTFDIEDDLGTSQTIANGDILLFSDGTFITPIVSATDTVTHDLSATGTASATTFLRGDNTWDTPLTGTSALTSTYIGYGDGANLLTGAVNFTFSGATGVVTLNSSGSTATIQSVDSLNITSSLVTGAAVLIDFSGSDAYIQLDDQTASPPNNSNFVVVGQNLTAGPLFVTNAMVLNSPTANSSGTGDTYTLLLQGLDDQNPIRIGFGGDQSGASYHYMIGRESISDSGGRPEQWFGGFSTLSAGAAPTLDLPWVPAFKQYMQNMTAGIVAFVTPASGTGEGPIFWGDDGSGGAGATAAVNFYQRQQIFDLGAGTTTLDYDTNAGAVCFADAGATVNLPQTNTLLGDTYEIFINPLTPGTVTIEPGTSAPSNAGQIDNLGIGINMKVGALQPFERGVKLICMGGTALGIQWAIIRGA